MTREDLKAWRKEHSYTQPELAQALSVHPVSISKWEHGIREIPPFLHLALERLECKGGKKGTRETKGGYRIMGSVFRQKN
jgi:DNA-binding XRE family transcriptional regulator